MQLTQLGNNTTAASVVNGTIVSGPNTVGRAYTGILTAQFANQTPTSVFNTINTGGRLAVAFSANFALTPSSTVSEPSTYAMMGMGLTGLRVADDEMRMRQRGGRRKAAHPVVASS